MSDTYFSCGHECTVRPDSGFPIRIKERDYGSEQPDGFNAVTHATCCHKCYVSYVTENPEDLIFYDWEEQEWLSDE